MPVDKIRYFPHLGCGITQKGVGEYFEDYPTFEHKADVGGFQEKKSVYIATWVKTAFVTQCERNCITATQPDCSWLNVQVEKK